MGITCGVDWADDHHNVVVMNDQGQVVAGRRIGTGVEGYAALLSLIADHGGSSAETPVALETDKNLLVLAFAVRWIHDLPDQSPSGCRYRERQCQAGKKSDHGDAAVLADILRTDRHQHVDRPAAPPRSATGSSPLHGLQPPT